MRWIMPRLICAKSYHLIDYNVLNIDRPLRRLFDNNKIVDNAEPVLNQHYKVRD